MANSSSPQEVEQLVQRLYQPGPPQEIKSIEEHLQQIQRSPQGWQLGDLLLQSFDQKVRFFGALTFTIKIKRDWDTLDQNDAASLLERLLFHFVKLVNSGETALVVRKLSNALIAYFLQPSISWDRCIFHVMACLARGEYVPFKAQAQSDSDLYGLSQSLNDNQLLSSLWFAGSLAEEGRQTLVISTESNKQHKKISSNVDDAVALLKHAMRHSQQEYTAVKRRQESMKCFQSWVMYAQRAWVDKALELGSLRSLTPLAIEALSQEDLYEEATEMLSDILSNFSAFLTPHDNSSIAAALSGVEAQTMVSELKNADFNPLAMAFARLLLAYGEASVQELAQKDYSNLQQALQYLMDLLRCDGYPGIDDEICSQALDFWATFVEFATDSLFTIDPIQKPSWMHRAQEQVVQVIEACWDKIRFPPNEIVTTWDSDARAGFQAFRSDFQDLLQTSYTLLGLSIFEKFAWLALKALEDRAWLHLEATVFCINALSEAVSDEEAVDDTLSRLFSSSLFADMANKNDSIPAKTRQSAVTMITKYIGFFERRVEYLPAMLNFLFDSVKAPAMTSVAAKAINTACSSCRKKLTGELYTFLSQYEAIMTWESVDFYGKEKVIGGIAAIVQALPSDEEKIVPLTRLIQFVKQDFDACLKSMTEGDPETYQAYGIGALKCLVSIGKSLQTPDEIAIDLDAESVPSQIWALGHGHTLQMAVVDILRKLTSLMSWNSDVMEAGCHVLRVGYKESTPGLFVFPASVTVEFVQAATLQTSRLEFVIDTGSAMLSRHNSGDKQETSVAATLLLTHSMQLLSQLNYNPSADPEVASSIIDLADKLVPRYISSMIETPEISRFFAFSLNCLASPEILPKRSAAHFWATFVNKYDFPEHVGRFMNAALAEYGLQLCRIIIQGIAGEAPRSMLDYLAEPLKKLVFAQQPQAKRWLSEVLQSDEFPSQKISAAQKRTWLQKVLSLRGARKTNNEVKDFWIACRGQETTFAI